LRPTPFFHLLVSPARSPSSTGAAGRRSKGMITDQRATLVLWQRCPPFLHSSIADLLFLTGANLNAPEFRSGFYLCPRGTHTERCDLILTLGHEKERSAGSSRQNVQDDSSQPLFRVSHGRPHRTRQEGDTAAAHQKRPRRQQPAAHLCESHIPNPNLRRAQTGLNRRGMMMIERVGREVDQLGGIKHRH
jgi:hypothetical protein